MSSAIEFLKHETSTLCQSDNFISIDLTFGVGDYVREVTSPAKFGSDPMSGRDATLGNINGLNIYGSCEHDRSFRICHDKVRAPPLAEKSR